MAVKALISKTKEHRWLLTMTDQAVVSAANFLTGIIIGRLCSREEFGLFAVGLSIVFFIIPLQNSLISTPYSIFSPHLQDSDRARLAGSALIQQLGLSALSTVLLITTAQIFSAGIGPQGLAAIVWVLSATITPILLKEFARYFCFAHLNMVAALVLDAAAAALQVGGFLALAHFGLLSASRAFWVLGATTGVTATLCLLYMRKQFILKISQAVSDLRKNWWIGKWVFGEKLAFIATMELYPWFLVFLHGPEAAGVFAASITIIGLARPFMQGMTNFLVPRSANAYAQGGKKEVHRVAMNYTVLILGVMVLFCGFMFINSEGVLRLVYGNKYAGNGQIVRLLSLMYLMASLTIPLCVGLIAIERPYLVFKSNIIQFSTTIILGFWLVKYFGPIGAAYSLLVGSMMAAIYSGMAFRKEFGTILPSDGIYSRVAKVGQKIG